MTCQTKGVPRFVSLNYFVDPSKMGLTVYLPAFSTNSDNIHLLARVGGPLLVGRAE